MRRPPSLRLALLVLCLVTAGLAAISPSGTGAQASTCSGGIYEDVPTAQSKFADDCGQPFRETPDFGCTWVPGGWQCTGPGNATGGDSTSGADSGDSNPPAESTTAARPAPPTFISVGYADRYVSVIWRNVPPDKVNVYRNDQYIATVDSGNVYNDFQGRAGDSYYLVRVRDGQFSEPSVTKRAAGRTAVADVRLHIPEGVKISWNSGFGVRYRIRRLDSGGAVQPGRGTVLATLSPGQSSFVDQNPKRGASYGIEGIKSDGTLLPIVTVTPAYNNPVVDAVPVGFEGAIHWQGGSEYRVRGNGYSCQKRAEPTKRFCTVPGPGDYQVTHLPSSRSWTVTVRADSPIVPKYTMVNGVRVLAADTYYGTQLVLRNRAEVKAATGMDVGSGSGDSGSGSGDTGSDSDSDDNLIYSVTKPGQTPAETSEFVGIVSVWEAGPDGTPGEHVGYYINGEFLTPEQYTHRVDGGLLVVEGVVSIHPATAPYYWVATMVAKVMAWFNNRPPADASPGGGTANDSGGDCVGSQCHNGVPLNEQTDPDGDGLSVFADDDNDNDGFTGLDDPDDLDPDNPVEGGKPDDGSTTGGGDTSNDDTSSDNHTSNDSSNDTSDSGGDTAEVSTSDTYPGSSFP